MMMLTVNEGEWVINDHEQLLLSESRFLTSCVVNQDRKLIMRCRVVMGKNNIYTNRRLPF